MHSRASEVLTGPFLRKRLEEAHSADLRIRGNSMAPVLPSGSVVRLRPLNSRETLKGSFVAVELGERVVVHRVDAEESYLVHTRGIRSRHCDPPTPRRQVIGVVSEHLGSVAVSEPTLRLAGNIVNQLILGLRWALGR